MGVRYVVMYIDIILCASLILRNFKSYFILKYSKSRLKYIKWYVSLSLALFPVCTPDKNIMLLIRERMEQL